MTFGERVLALRTEKGMTQDELAKILGYKSRSSINKIEVGERSIPTSILYRLANALDLSFIDLIFCDVNNLFLEENKNKEVSDNVKWLMNMSDDERKDAFEYAIENTFNNVNAQRQELLDYYDSLNEDGKSEALIYISNLANNNKYKK